MSTVWDRTAEFLSENLVALTPLVLLGMFVPLTLLGNLLPLMGSSGEVGDWTLGVVMLLLSLVTNWAGLAITAMAFDPAAGRGAAVAIANRRLVPLIGIGLVTLAALAVLTLPVGIILGLGGMPLSALAGGKLQASDVNGGALALAMLYGMVLCVVLFWAYARFVVLITPIVVLERRGLGVFGRNFVLTRRIAWKVMGVVLLYGVVSWVASAAAKTVFGSIFALLIGGEGAVTLASVLTHIVTAAVSTLFSLLAVAFVAKLYLAGRDAREAIVTLS